MYIVNQLPYFVEKKKGREIKTESGKTILA